MTVIGYHKSEFSFDDGRSCSGVTLYVGSKIDPPGQGWRTEKCFLTNEKLRGYFPKLNDEVFIERNSNGRALGIFLVNPAK